MIQHPLSKDAASTANDARQTPFELGQMLNQQTSMDGLVVDTLLAVLLDDVQKVFFRQLLN